MSAPLYKPESLIPQPYNISLLSQRDVHLQVPINFVPAAGVSLSAACFAHGIYEYNALSQCFSNLLSMGYGRFEIDLYWDSMRRIWSLCPAAIPAPGPSSTTVPATVTETSRNGLATAQEPVVTSSAPPSLSTPSSSETSAQVAPRQVVETFTRPITDSSGSVFQTTQLITVNPQITSQATSPTASTTSILPYDGEAQYALGPYNCSPDVDLQFVIELMKSYLGSTDNTLQAQIKYLIFNVHAASPLNDPTAPASRPDNSSLPVQQDLIGAQFNAYLSPYLYTPALLMYQRANVEESWFDVDTDLRPDKSYFRTEDGRRTSPDGWPSESFVEFEEGQRLLLGLGNVDPQMANYSNGLDNGLVFSPDMISSFQPDISFAFDGKLSAGCIFDSQNSTVAGANSSFAITTGLPASAFSGAELLNINSTIYPVSNLTSCGISYMLNNTLLNRTADTDPEPYRNFLLSAAIWSWAPGEPLGDSAFTATDPTVSGGQKASPSGFRCATLDSSSYGRWRTSFCESSNFGACRSDSNPYDWSLTEGKAQHYRQLDRSCPDDYTFAVPRTALENAYLLQAVRDASQDRVFINLNSIEVESCWVVGIDTSCPYLAPSDSNTAAIAVPTLAAIIILVITAFVLVVKCGANRSASRKRRVGGSGWDYEGVPS